MRVEMKLYLIVTSLLCTTLYSAEKLNADKIIRESHATGKPISQETVNQLMKQQETRLAKEAVELNIIFGQRVSTKTISRADPETAALAHQHNQKLSAQLQAQQPK